MKAFRRHSELRKVLGFPLLLIFWGAFPSFGQEVGGDSSTGWPGLPASVQRLQVVEHWAYALGYDERFEQAAWTQHMICRATCGVRAVERSDNFRADPKVRTGSAGPKDFSGSGYDRGHLAPAADFAWSARAMSESFFMSNMSPQTPGFNRGIWKQLEEAVRDWACSRDTLYVISGPILTEDLDELGSGVAIPDWYFKVIYDPSPTPTAIAFLLRNASGTPPLSRYAVSIDEVESRTGLDFLPLLPEEIERELEQMPAPVRKWF
ncbi:MAG: hypothetical protein RJA19_413 [Bacteroidota bacterium]|jgi:endonuclease G